MTLVAERELIEMPPKSIGSVERRGPGKVIAVWSPVGSPGKSTIALNLAYELASMGKRTLLIDLDLTAPSLGLMLNLGEPMAGVTAVARLVRQQRFDIEQLFRLSVGIKKARVTLRFLPGLTSPKRWVEVTPETVTRLLNVASSNFDAVIVDVASELSDSIFQTDHPVARNAATRQIIAEANCVLSVISDTKISISRYLQQFHELDSLNRSRLTIVNRFQGGSKIQAALKALTKERVFATVPEDLPSAQLAEGLGLPLALARRKSLARQAIAALAHKLLEWQPSQT